MTVSLVEDPRWVLQLWPGGPIRYVCPMCRSDEVLVRDAVTYQCENCGHTETDANCKADPAATPTSRKSTSPQGGRVGFAVSAAKSEPSNPLPPPAGDQRMKQIESRASKYAAALSDLGTQLAELNAELELAKKPFMSQLRRTIARVDRTKAALTEEVEGHPELFESPRTHVLHGIKCGFVKAKDSVNVPDVERSIALIRRYLGDQESVLIKVYESVVSASLNQLSDQELKKIGCRRMTGQDQVVVKPQDGEPEKLRKALIGE